jgi:hypothetical protein
VHFSATHYNARMSKMIGLRIFGIFLLAAGVVAGLEFLFELTRPSLLNAALWLLGCVACLKAGSTWVKETGSAWSHFRWERTKAEWRGREPDWWWLTRYPLHITVSSLDPSFVHPDGTIERLYSRPSGIGDRFEQFKRDLTVQGYGPDKRDPRLDGAIDRWLKRHYEEAEESRAGDFQ